MRTSQKRLLSEVAAGHDGPEIPAAKRAYFQERFRGRVFDFLLEVFLFEQANGLTKAKLARRTGKSPEVINRWLGAPSNLTLDSVSDILLGAGGYEMNMSASPLLNRQRSERRFEATPSNLDGAKLLQFRYQPATPTSGTRKLVA